MRRLGKCLGLGASLWLAACNQQDMDHQSKLLPNAASQTFPDNAADRPLPPGTVAQSDLARDAAIANPPPADAALLARGRERFDIFCSPCHGRTGNGRGMAVERGFPAPPSYHSARLVAAPAQHFFDVITHGYGVMYSYAARVPPRDRWAIVAYIRALQLSQSRDLVAKADKEARP